MSWRSLKRVVCGLGLLLAGVSALWAEGGAWTKKADMPTPRNSFAAAAVDGWIYTFGGRVSPTGGLPTVEAYHPATDQWVKKADMPTGRRAASAVVVDGKIYVMGGITGDADLRAAFPVVEVYDPATDTWTRKADMLQPRSFTTAELVDGKVYVIAGWSTGGIFSVVQEYDAAIDTWIEKGRMPIVNSHFASGAVGGHIYVIGGLRSPSTLFAYDPAADTWESKENLPIGRVLAGVSVVNGMLYVMGGVQSETSNTSLSLVGQYDPSTGIWVEQAAMPTARAGLSSVVVDGRIYAIGGALGAPWIGSKTVGPVEEFTPDRAQTAVELSTWGKVKKQAP